jgi:hypothetical protein
MACKRMALCLSRIVQSLDSWLVRRGIIPIPWPHQADTLAEDIPPEDIRWLMSLDQ